MEKRREKEEPKNLRKSRPQTCFHLHGSPEPFCCALKPSSKSSFHSYWLYDLSGTGETSRVVWSTHQIACNMGIKVMQNLDTFYQCTWSPTNNRKSISSMDDGTSLLLGFRFESARGLKFMSRLRLKKSQEDNTLYARKVGHSNSIKWFNCSHWSQCGFSRGRLKSNFLEMLH